MTEEEKKVIQAQIDEWEQKKFYNAMNDHWVADDYAFDRKCAEEIKKLKAKLKEVTE